MDAAARASADCPVTITADVAGSPAIQIQKRASRRQHRHSASGSSAISRFGLRRFAVVGNKNTDVVPVRHRKVDRHLEIQGDMGAADARGGIADHCHTGDSNIVGIAVQVRAISVGGALIGWKDGGMSRNG